MIKKLLFASSLVLIYCLKSYSILPNSNKIWYFGNHAGIDFNNPAPIALTDGVTNTYDNTATIADDQGTLQFYSDGQTVWNRNHQVMVNGTGLFGDITGGQPALFIKQPDPNEGNSKFYYIFSVPEYGSGGLYYSIVDISLDSGRGEIVSKNNLLYTSTCEKLAAIYNSSTNSYWIISHEFNNANFKCYQLDENGLNTSAVISTVGASNSGGTYGALHGSVGQLVISEDGTHIANAMNYSSQIQLFDFDMISGTISNPITITNRTSAWGVAFSPDGNFLYTTNWTSAGVFQYNLTNYNSAAINASLLTVGTITNPNSSYRAGYLKLGPDGKVYIAKYGSNYLATINNPDASGSLCNFVDNGFNLGSGICHAGLVTTVVLPNSIIGVSELKKVNSIVYPNPSNCHFSIKSDFKLSNSVNVKVMNITGQQVPVTYIVDKETIRLNMENLSKGIYFYNFQDDNKTTSGKLILQ